MTERYDTFRLNGRLVDAGCNTVGQHGKTRKLEPRAMAVLRYLAENHGRVVSRMELEQAVWRNRIVGYDALGNSIVKIRKVLGDSARDPKFIETVSKTGYRLIAVVETSGRSDPGTAVADARAGTSVTSRDSGNPIAQACFLRARELDRNDNQTDNEQANRLFTKAIRLDPDFSNAYSHLGRNRAVCYINQWSPDTEDLLENAQALGYQAIAADRNNPHGYFSAAASTLWLKDHDKALELNHTALKLDPRFPEAHALRGMILTYMGQPDKALAALEAAMKLDPYYRDAYLHISAQALFHLGRFGQAAEQLRCRLIRKPDSDTSRVLLAACCGHLDKTRDGRKYWYEVTQINPRFSLRYKQSILPYKDSSMYRQVLDGIGKLGIDPGSPAGRSCGPSEGLA